MAATQSSESAGCSGCHYPPCKWEELLLLVVVLLLQLSASPKYGPSFRDRHACTASPIGFLFLPFSSNSALVHLIDSYHCRPCSASHPGPVGIPSVAAVYPGFPVLRSHASCVLCLAHYLLHRSVLSRAVFDV